jgi:hypothetical protein
MNEADDIKAFLRANRPAFIEQAQDLWRALGHVWDMTTWAIGSVEKREALHVSRDVAWWRRIAVRVAVRIRVLTSSEDDRADFVEALRAASDQGYSLWNTEWPLLETLAEVLLIIEHRKLCYRLVGGTPTEQARLDLLVRNFNKTVALHASGSISAESAAHILEHALVSTNWVNDVNGPIAL